MLRPPSLAPSPYASPLPTPRLGHADSSEAGDGDGGALAALGSTETLQRGGDELLLSSCESAKTICSKDVGGEASPRTPSISVEEDRDDATEVDSLADGSVGVAASEDRFDWAAEETPPRPDSLKGIRSFQRSHSNLASLGLAFPAPNGSLAISRWPSAAERGAVPEDWESYTYSPGYERARSKTSENNDRCVAIATVAEHQCMYSRSQFDLDVFACWVLLTLLCSETASHTYLISRFSQNNCKPHRRANAALSSHTR